MRKKTTYRIDIMQISIPPAVDAAGEREREGEGEGEEFTRYPVKVKRFLFQF